MPTNQQISYIAALLPTSYTFAGNVRRPALLVHRLTQAQLALVQLGVQAVSPLVGSLSPLQRVQLWHRFFDRAAVRFSVRAQL